MPHIAIKMYPGRTEEVKNCRKNQIDPKDLYVKADF